MATEPAISAETNQPKVPFLLRRAGETRVLLSPLSPEQVRERFSLYLGVGKRRQELTRVQGRTVVAMRVGDHLQMNSYRRYLLGALTTAFCILDETPGGTRVLMTLSTMRYKRVYTVGLLLAGIVGILIFAPANALWMRTLLAFGILMVVSNWRLSRATRQTVEEKHFLAEFVRNLLDAEVVSKTGRRSDTETDVPTMAKGRSG